MKPPRWRATSRHHLFWRGYSPRSASSPIAKPGHVFRRICPAGRFWSPAKAISGGWDGYAAAGDAPTAAARRLSERNRLGDLEREAAQARDEAELARRDLDFAQASARAAASAENQAMEAARQARRSARRSRHASLSGRTRRCGSSGPAGRYQGSARAARCGCAGGRGTGGAGTRGAGGSRTRRHIGGRARGRAPARRRGPHRISAGSCGAPGPRARGRDGRPAPPGDRARDRQLE